MINNPYSRALVARNGDDTLHVNSKETGAVGKREDNEMIQALSLRTRRSVIDSHI